MPTRHPVPAPTARADMYRRRPDLARAATIQDGLEAATRDLEGCSTVADVEHLRGIAYGNLAGGSPLERAYFEGYDHMLALAVGAGR